MDKQELSILRTACPRPKPAVKTVIFDLGNVVLAFDNSKITGFISRISGFKRDEVREFVFGTKLERSIDLGKITTQEYLDRINRRFSSKIGIRAFTKTWCNVFTRVAGIESIIRKLKRNNYRLGVLSNTNKTHFEFVEREFPVLKLFDDYHLSYKTGYAKPDKRAFENLIAFYGREPRSLFFADDIAANVAAARAAGINAVCFKSAARLARDLKSRGVILK